MPEPKKDLLDELAEDGLDPEIITRLRAWSEGSPLRRVARSAEQRASDAEAEAARLREAVKRTTFRDAGIQVDPQYLSLPDDLDVTDVAAVKKWGIDAKFISPGPNVDNSELEEHESAEAAVTGTDTPDANVITPVMVAEWGADRIIKFKQANPDAFEALKRGEEVRGIPVS